MAATRIHRAVAVGDTFGRLAVLRPAERYFWRGKPHGKQWACLCACNTETIVRECHLQNGRVVSCGCHAREQSGNRTRTHGGTAGGRSAEYNVWCMMRRRCGDPNDAKYADYGGRGIRVCDRWLGCGGFANFLADMGARPSPRHSIERRDNAGCYEPANCEWALPFKQSRNKRSNHVIEHDGRRMCLTDWALHVGITRRCLTHRIEAGWSLSRALSR